MSTPPLPIELFHEIIQSLRDDTKALKQCALACSALRYIVQQHLFAELLIYRFPLRMQGSVGEGDELEETRCSWLSKPEHSHLLSHVRHLIIQCYPTPSSSFPSRPTVPISSIPDPAFLILLDRIPAESIHKITILRRHRDDPLPDTERIITSALKRCTALWELRLEDRRVPARYLAAISASIRVLRLSGTEFVEDYEDRVGNRAIVPPFVSSWPNLEALIFPGKLSNECLSWMVVGGATAADSDDDGCVFPRLKSLFVGDQCRDVEVVNRVLQMCRSTLRSLVYTPLCHSFLSYPNPCLNQNGIPIEFTTPHTLRTLAINCPIMLKPSSSQNYLNPFRWLTQTLQKLCIDNDNDNDSVCALETIHIKFLTTIHIERLDALFPGGFPIDDCFGEFDRLLSDQSKFPGLRNVYLTVGRHYLSLFRGRKALPSLRSRGLVKVVREEIILERARERSRYWLCDVGDDDDGGGGGDGVGGNVGGMMCVESLPWDGRICELV